jgi:hypothetical protein
MEYFQELRDKARQKLKTADYMLVVTYPSIKDPKLLLAVLENLSEGLDFGITAVLEHERLFKTIPPYPDNIQGKIELFKQKLAPRLKMDDKELRLLNEVRELLLDHKQSVVEFRRKDQFVMTDQHYSNIKTLDSNKLKQFVARGKVLVEKLYELTTKNDAMFG